MIFNSRALASPAVQDSAKKTHFFLASSITLRCAAWGGGGKQLGEQQLRLSEGIKECRSYKCITDSIRKPVHELLWMPHLRIPSTVPRLAPPMLCAPHPHTFPPHGQLPTHNPDAARVNLRRLLVCTWRKLVHLYSIRRNHKDSHVQHYSRESKQRGGC